MARVIPWLRNPGDGASKAAAPGRHVAPPRAKRRRVVEPSSDIDDEREDARRGGVLPDLRSSPPPALEPPSQILMDEGLDKDDKFRMVEDEFLDVAKQFTQHLHAAEYKRLKRAARSQNAAIISSISRPVTIKMPDETRRKVESMARVKKQSAAVRAVLRREDQGSGSEDEMDGYAGAWLGTALHGLMESPRKSTASLTGFGKMTVSSRAALGFHKPGSKTSLHLSQSPSNDLESFEATSLKGKLENERSFESTSEDDEDLDAPVRSRIHHMHDGPTKLELAANAQTAQNTLEEVLPNSFLPSVIASTAMIADYNNDHISPRGSAKARDRISKRLQQSRLRRLKDEQDPHEKLENIPMFLS